ncbi:HET-domain-containing protein, partial [Parathielavia hyrcaniae]
DAVQVKRRLGVPFFWADSLCIIQDDKGDCEREAARMGDVYMNAYCTIAAHAAHHADHGFLQESMQREKVVAVGGHANGEPSRGWALQERILSPFTVHFGPAGSLYLNSRNRRYPSSTTAALSVIPRTYHGWYEMLTQYSACFLTNPRDKLIALSGIVQRCEGLIGDTYTGGIWINNFIHCLLWLRQKGALEQDVAAPAPTWSWASVKRKIQY